MKVQNIGGKIVSIGNVTILPGEAKPVPDSFANNAAVACLVEHKNIKLICGGERESTTSQSQGSGEKPGDDKTGETDDGSGKKPLSRMNKAELVEECRRLNIEVSEEDTKDTLAEKIRATTAE